MAINIDDPHLVEHLTMIVDAFERDAYHSNQRKMLVAVAENPLSAMQGLLEGSQALLHKVHRPPSRVAPPQTADAPPDSSAPNSPLQGSIDIDMDLVDLIASTTGNSTSEAAANYLRNCLNCDTRLQFDWQLQPLNLLGPISAMLQGIKTSIGNYEMRLDPFKSLEGLCGLLNATQGICLPDLAMALMSIKMLLKHYATNTLSIRLDWTSVFGPLLKAILEGIVHLLDGAVSVIAAPLDCMTAGLTAASKVERETRNIMATVESIMNGSLESDASFDVSLIRKSPKWIPGGAAPDTGELAVTNSDRGSGRNANASAANLGLPNSPKSLISGFTLDASTSLEDALKDPSFIHASFIDKLILPIQDAGRFIKELLANLTKTLESLCKLTSGGLSVNLDNLGIILFLMDTVSLIMMIIRMRQQNPRVTDWCDFLGRNPAAVESMLSDRLGRLTVEHGGDDNLILRRGPEKVGEIHTCSNQRSNSQNRLVQQWIDDLKRKQQ